LKIPVNLDFNHSRLKVRPKVLTKRAEKVTRFGPFGLKIGQNTFKAAASGAILTFLKTPNPDLAQK
jgi:hypothetical protein